MNRYKINRLVILSIFLLMGVGTLLLVNYLKSEQSTDLSHITIDDMHLNSTVDKNQLIEFDDIVLKKYKFYEKYNQPDLVFKVNKANNKLKGMSLLKNTKVKTNFGGEIEGHVQDVVRELGNNYKQKKLRNSYYLMTYYDKNSHTKLSIMHKHDKIKKIEIYTK